MKRHHSFYCALLLLLVWGCSDPPSSDASGVDAARSDTSAPDASTHDASTHDTPAPEASAREAGGLDAGAVDTRQDDAGLPDATASDTSHPDASRADASGADAGGGGHFYDEGSLTLEAITTAADWDRVRGAYLYFGHQSVGGNILAGLDTLMAEDPSYTIQRAYLWGGFASYGDAPALGDNSIGNNYDPASKIAAFDDMLRNAGGSPLGNNVAIAFMKFCYVDFDATTDVSAIFDSYRSTLAALEHDYPATLIVYTTVPLKLGLHDWDFPDNIARNQFNTQVRDHCGTSGRPLLDVAALEATLDDGSRCTFTDEGVVFDALCETYSAGGGDAHLNTEGSKRIAKVMMLMLADLLRRQ